MLILLSAIALVGCDFKPKTKVQTFNVQVIKEIAYK